MSFAGRFLVRAFSFVRTLILIRLLVPDDFGAFAITLTVWLILDVFTRAGIVTALVQQQDDIDDYLGTVWTLNFVRGLAISGLLFALAPFIAGFFQAPGAVNLLRVMALAFFLRHLINPGVIYFQRNLEMHKFSSIEVSRSVAEAGTSIAFVLLLGNVWGMVIGFVVGEGVTVALSYAIHDFKPRFTIEKEKLRRLYRFGIWIYLGNVFDLISDQMDKVILTRTLGPMALGLYQIATRFSFLMSSEISKGIYSVGFPTFARIQSDIPAVRFAYLAVIDLSASVIAPFTVVTVLLADEFALHVLGDNWTATASAMKILAVAGLFMTLKDAQRALLLGLGRPEYAFRINAVGNIVMLGAVYPLTLRYGLDGAAIAVLLAAVSTVPLQLFQAFRLLNLRWWPTLSSILPAGILSAAIGLSLIALERVYAASSLASLIVFGIVAVFIYALVSLLLWRAFNSGPLARLAYIRSA